MKRAVTALALLCLSTSAQATEIGSSRAFGMGLVLGSPSGVTGKLYLNGRSNALDFALGSWYVNNGLWGGYYVHVNHHWHFAALASGQGVTIPWRVGVGGFLTDGAWGYWNRFGGFALGLRVPFGLDFDLERAPVQFFIEIAPAIPIIANGGLRFGLGFDAGIGARYYF